MTRCNLILHCGANAVPRHELSAVQTPAATDTWQPIPHEEYVERIERALPRHGLQVVQEAHALTHDGSRYFGLMQIQNGCTNPDYTWVLGLRNSHDKTLPAGLVAGSQVFVCDNLAFSGEVQVSRKHTTNILLDHLVPNRWAGESFEAWLLRQVREILAAYIQADDWQEETARRMQHTVESIELDELDRQWLLERYARHPEVLAIWEEACRLDHIRRQAA